jgi:anti-anti-sigma factor
MPAPLEPRFLVDTEVIDERTQVVSANGELHMSTAPKLGAHLTSALRHGGADRLVIDLTNVQFIDSTGLGVLLSILREVQHRGGRMTIAANNPTVLRLFAITGTDTTLRVLPDRGAALSAVSDGDGLPA